MERPSRRLRPLWSRLCWILSNRRQTTVIGSLLNHLGGTPVRGRCTGQPLWQHESLGVCLCSCKPCGVLLYFCSCNPCGVRLSLLTFAVQTLWVLLFFFCVAANPAGCFCILIFFCGCKPCGVPLYFCVFFFVQTSSAGALLLPFFARLFIPACSSPAPHLHLHFPTFNLCDVVPLLL